MEEVDANKIPYDILHFFHWKILLKVGTDFG